MIGEHWQTVLALCCVAAALWVLVRRAAGLFGDSPGGGCGSGGCGSCEQGQPAAAELTSDGFVNADVLTSFGDSMSDLPQRRSGR